MQNTIAKARILRKRMTDAEMKLWQELRHCQIEGFRFRKQVPLGPYIIDFVCFERRVAIEVDGGQHNENREYDQKRTNWLQEQGYTVQRFWNHEVLLQLEAVKEVIRELCITNFLS